MNNSFTDEKKTEDKNDVVQQKNDKNIMDENFENQRNIKEKDENLYLEQKKKTWNF